MATIDQGDEPAFPVMAPADVQELTEELEDKQNGLKQEGSEALEDGKQDVALEKFSEAIGIGCASAMLIARRGALLLQMDRPRAAVNDCTAALAINPDSAKAFKTRARAYLKLEMLEEAHSDFQTGLKIDYDDQTDEDSKEVAAKVKDIQAAKGKAKAKSEEEEYHKTMKENKEKYEAGLKEREGEWKEKEEAEKAAKAKAEEERKARVRAREKDSEAQENVNPEEPGVPKSHAPPEPEDVD